ncbi:hypothetical protein BGZ46_009221 [Entomortierella lignicola]|nr:hypothetical protein BGZ46_009221 [Entomortierella lignicola]
MELHKSNWERVVSALQGRIRALSLNKVVSRFSESITEHWAETLEVIRIRQLYVPDSHIELILTTCSKLKTFSVATSLNITPNPFEDYGIGLSMSLRNDPIISQVDWVCLELENLELLVLDPRMVIQQTTAGNGTLDTSTMEEYTINGIKRVYRQIGRLSKLQHIRLGWWTVMNYETCSNLDMSIESGLGYLEGLKELRVLDIGCIQRVNIGQSEVEWIADNWPRIRKIKGLFFKDSDFSANDDEYEFEKIDGEITIDKYGIEIYETGSSLDLGDLGMGVLDGDNVKLKDVAGVDDRFIYSYDMGDDWQHEVRVEKIVAFKPRTKLPSCTGGARACPPEDCGGIYGYVDLMKTMAGPDSDEKEELSEWLEKMDVDFDPEYFDKAEANFRLEFYKTIM